MMPSPALRRFLTAAILAHGSALARTSNPPSPALKRELGELVAWLNFTPEADLSGLEQTSDAPVTGSGDGSSGKRGRSTAVSRSEAAQLLQISERQIDRLIAGGQLPKQKVGRRTLIARADIESFMKEAS